jgi:hypothetical protein
VLLLLLLLLTLLLPPQLLRNGLGLCEAENLIYKP